MVEKYSAAFGMPEPTDIITQIIISSAGVNPLPGLVFLRVTFRPSIIMVRIKADPMGK